MERVIYKLFVIELRFFIICSCTYFDLFYIILEVGIRFRGWYYGGDILNMKEEFVDIIVLR